MKKIIILFLAACFLIVLAGSQTQAALMSTFDTSAEGWTGDPPLSWDPGGYVVIQSDGRHEFFPPASWLGNWSQYLHGVFEFDFKSDVEVLNLLIFTRHSQVSEPDIPQLIMTISVIGLMLSFPLTHLVLSSVGIPLNKFFNMLLLCRSVVMRQGFTIFTLIMLKSHRFPCPALPYSSVPA